ncbi:carboxypeptidase regulatory-like domain-containing protein [Candidatus Ozemobacteraceae bacterium]|nr:carboxypeptidase regulatory-like domain-containing protein [Candidatus Ozemobacteraceae bacterium]
MRHYRLIALVVSLGTVLLSFGCGGGVGDDPYGQTFIGSTGVVSGRVLDNGLIASGRVAAVAPTGQPLSGASIWIEELPDRRTVSSSDGRFTIDNLPVGTTYHLVVRHDDTSRGIFRSRSEGIALNDQQRERQLDLGIRQADRAVTMIVRDSEGNPMIGGTVTFWGETQRVDSQGRVTVQMPADTSLDILAAAPGKDPVAIPVTFEANSQEEIAIGLQTTGSVNRPPLVRLAAGSSVRVARNDELSLTATAFDPDGDTLSYLWGGTAGAYVSSGTAQTTARWRAPDFDTTASVSVEVADGHGGRSHAVLGVTVGAGGTNRAPVASILASGTRIEYATGVRLTAQVSDPDGDVVTCVWRTDRGSLQASTGTTTVWTSPSTSGAATISLEAGDSLGASTTTRLVITVLAPNSAPTLAISATGTSVLPTAGVTLTAQGSDIDGDPLSYAWSASGGMLSAVSGPSVLWHAPATEGVVTITCLASDGRGGTADASYVFSISSSPNNVPAISVSASRRVTAEGVNVSVLATGYDADGDSLTYRWKATGGTFADITSARTSWIPGVGSQTYTLSCEARDSRGSAATATIEVRVMETACLDVGGTQHFGPAGSGREIALTTPSGQGRFGVLVYSLDRTGTNHSFDVNGGGTVLPAVSGAPAFSIIRPGFPAGQAAVDAVMRRKASESPYRLSGTSGIRPSLRASEANVGDTHTFKVYSTSGYQERSARLAVIGTKCKVFIDQNEAGGYSPAEVTDAMMTEFANEFDSQIWSFINDNYGSPSNLADDDKVTILFTPIVNSIGAAGFFDPTNLMTGDSHSNNRDMFNMWIYAPKDGYTLDWWKEATRLTLVHEFQHLVNTWTHMQKHIDEEAVWLNEGLSVGAEVRYSNARDDRFDAYSERPELVPLTEWPYDATVANYGCVGLFAHHVYERFGGAAIRSMVQSTSSGTANVEAHSGGTSFDQLFREWGVAMYRNNKGLTGMATDYRLNVELDMLKKTQKSFGNGFSGSVYGTAWRFIEYLPPVGYADQFTTIRVSDPGSGNIAFSIVRIQN